MNQGLRAEEELPSLYRRTALAVGILFIAATVTAVLSGIVQGSILNDADYLVNVAANENRLIAGAILELVMAMCLVGIGVLMFPILRRDREGLALGYAGVRITEAIAVVIGTVALLSIVTLGKSYGSGALDASYYAAPGEFLAALRDWALVLGTMIFLGLGGLVLNYLLYRSRLIPRFLSLWGLVGAGLILATGAWCLFGLSPDSTTTTIMAVPIGLQEMVFALWIIFRGFHIAPARE